MEYKIKNVLPEDIFVSCSTDSQDDGSENGGRLLSGHQVLDVIAALIHRYGHMNCKDMAKRLGKDPEQLSCAVNLISGLNFNEWRDRYLMLMCDYITLHEPKFSVEAYCRRLGFSCRSTRTRFEERMKKGR